MNRLLSLLILSLALTRIAPVNAQDGEPAAVDTIAFETWQDIAFGFSADVPAGWTVELEPVFVGSTVFPFLTVVSPDETIVLMAGTPDAGLFADYDPDSGTFEGLVVPVGDSAYATVRTYAEPAVFLEDYLRTRLLILACATELRVGHAAEVDTGMPEAEAGEVDVVCVHPEGQSAGTFFLQIVRFDTPDAGALWFPEQLYGFLATDGNEAMAEQALLRLAATLITGPPEATATEEPTLEPGTGADTLDGRSLAQIEAEAQASQFAHELTMSLLRGSSYTYEEYEWEGSTSAMPSGEF